MDPFAPTLTDPDDSNAPVRREKPPLGRGAALGRYVVLDRLGEGRRHVSQLSSET